MSYYEIYSNCWKRCFVEKWMNDGHVDERWFAFVLPKHSPQTTKNRVLHNPHNTIMYIIRVGDRSRISVAREKNHSLVTALSTGDFYFIFISKDRRGLRRRDGFSGIISAFGRRCGMRNFFRRRQHKFESSARVLAYAQKPRGHKNNRQQSEWGTNTIEPWRLNNEKWNSRGYFTRQKCFELHSKCKHFFVIFSTTPRLVVKLHRTGFENVFRF